MNIKIVSRWEHGKPTACHACVELKKLTRLALDELGLNKVSIDECASEEEYKSYGVMATPILIINGKIKTSGRVVPKEMLKEFLKFELEREKTVTNGY
jgi:alkyl hydroperoxide reductase subunit AhpF